MIIRRSRNRQEAKATTLSFALEYSAKDVKQILREWYALFNDHYKGLHTPPEKAHDMAIAILTTSESDWLYSFAHHPYFAPYPAKYADMFASWAFHIAIKEGYIKASIAEPGKYYLADVPQRAGRPKENDC